MLSKTLTTTHYQYSSVFLVCVVVCVGMGVRL